MYAFRSTWQIKYGQMGRALELLQEASKILNLDPEADPERSGRVYTPDISPDYLVFEENWTDLAARDAWWAEFNSQQAAGEWWAKWNEVVAQHIGSERWQVKVL